MAQKQPHSNNGNRANGNILETRRKSDSIRRLEVMANEAAAVQYPAAARHGALAPRKYSDRTANALTRAVVDFLNLSGWQAERISVTGRPIDQSRIVKDVTGCNRRIGNVKWIPGNMTPGSADVSATIKGRSVKIEIKIGKDRQSEAQMKYQSNIELAGGTYVIIHNFDEFLSWYNSFIE